MAQFQSPETYVDGQQVTATRLNNQTNGAIALPGLITDQTNITANTVASDDSVLLYDLSATALREATVSDILGSSLPVVASTIAATSVATNALNAGANSDILVTPNDGANVTGKTFVSADGITSTVSSTAHGLVTGQNVTITASNAAYSGTYRITVTTVDAFTYVLFPTSTAASGTCSYVREGSVRVAGELNTTGGLNVAGAAVVSGATRIAGTLTSSGTANFTGNVQYSGTPVYGLSSITETTIPSGGCDATSSGQLAATCNQWITVATIPSLTKTNKEIWRVYATTPCVAYVALAGAKVRLVQTSTGAVLARADIGATGATGWQYHYLQFCLEAIIAESTVFTGDSIKFEVRYNAGAVTAGAIMRVGDTGYFSDGITSKVTISKYIKP